MSYTIITHDGKAHIDEILASALLTLYREEEPESIIRMDSQKAAKLVEEGNIPENTYFIDCGMALNSEKKLFDHHQNRELDCAALLVFNEYFSDLFNTELHDYIKLVSKVDTKGAMSLDDFHLVSESRDYFSFSHSILIRSFEDNPKMVLHLLKKGLEDKINFEKAKKIASKWRSAPGNIKIASLDGLKVLRYLVKPPSELVSPLRSEINKVIEENDISVTISFDDKIPEAKTLYRTNYGHNHIDFTKSKPSHSLFCHQGGFLLKFIPPNDEEWEKLVNQALVSPKI